MFKANTKHWTKICLLLLCGSDLEDDVWRKVSDSSDGTVFYLHGGHLQWVLQQRPHHLQLIVARRPYVWAEHLEVRTFHRTKFEILLLFFSPISKCLCLVQLANVWCIPSSSSVLAGSQYLSMDPVVPGVFTDPYPFGIDPVQSPSWLHFLSCCYFVCQCVQTHSLLFCVVVRSGDCPTTN